MVDCLTGVGCVGAMVVWSRLGGVGPRMVIGEYIYFLYRRRDSAIRGSQENLGLDLVKRSKI